MKCLGRNLDEHCCWVNGKVCKFLEENTEKGFRWTCGLLRQLGNWDAVLSDERYKESVEPYYWERAERIGVPVSSCRDYPSGKESCTHCGANC